MSEDQLPSQLQAAEGTPIAQLSPEIQNTKTRVVRGVVTITWPYSIINKTVAFLLAEPDFRLRRAKGQVRVEFSGSSAQSVQDAGLGSGDEVTLSLDGVELVVDDSKTRVPGTSLGWQLKFKDRLLLQAKISDSEEVKLIDIDHPVAPEPAAEPEPAPDYEQLPASVLDSFKEPAKSPEPVFATPVRSVSAKRPADLSLGLDEYASPAFLKRARMSYGSLFEDSQDIFEEDISAKARAKKRTKSGRYSGVWRYASQSPSPEPQTLEEEKEEKDEEDDTPMADEQSAAATPTATPSRPKMVDGGCQTMELDASPPRDVQVAAEARHDPSQFWQTPSKSTMIDSGVQSDLNLGMPSDLHDNFVQTAPIPMFTSAHEHYPQAFDQPPLGPVFSHEIHPSGMEGQYHAEESFHEHSDSYPEAGLEHGVESHGQYPTSFLEAHHFDPHLAATTQPATESMPAYEEHHTPQGHVAEPEHHTEFIDGITEPQQTPWGMTSLQRPRSPTRPVDGAIAGFKSVNAQAKAGLPTEDQAGTQAIPSDNWHEDNERQTAEHDEDPEGKQAALRVEEDQVSEDHDGPEEEVGSKTYAERHWETIEQKAEEKAATALEDPRVSSEGSDSGSGDSDAEAENEEDDAGGDYDITNYRNLSNNQDDDDGSDLESDYGREDEEEIYDSEVQANEDDEVDEEAEDAENLGEYDDYEEEEEDEEEEDEENQPPPASRAAPQVISLLSDSEDEDDEPPPAAPAAQPRQVPQYDGSSDEEDAPEDEEESDKENVRQNHQISSSVISDEESEGEDESDQEPNIGTPTPRPRESRGAPEVLSEVNTSSPQAAVSDSADMTTATVGKDFETMSPIKIPQIAEHAKDSSSRPVSRDDSEMLEAELEHELEEEIAAEEARHDQETTDELVVKTDAAGETRSEEISDPAAVSEVTNIEVTEVQVETMVQTEEVRDAPEITSAAEVDLEPADRGTAEAMDINMADADEKPVDEVARGGPEESKMDVAEADESLLDEEMDEEQLIQSQLEDETMAEIHLQTIITLEAEATELDETSPTRIDDEMGEDASPRGSSELKVTEKLQVEVSSTTEVLVAASPKDQELCQRQSEDAMDVDEARSGPAEMASPPPTQAQSQSEEVISAEPQDPRASEDHAEDNDVSLVQLPTPRETQVTESFVSQSMVDTQDTEEVVADRPSPDSTSKRRLEEETLTATVENPENPGDAASPINEGASQIRDSSAQPSEAHSSLIAEDLAEEINTAQPNPRRGRGHRRNKSDNKDLDPSVKLARASIASRRSTRLSDRTTPDSTRVTSRARSHSLALRSDSPEDEDDEGVQLARAANKSPSRAAAKEKEAPATPAGDNNTTTTTASLKSQLTKSLQDVPDCISLKVLRNHPGRAVDVLAIATTEPPEAKRAKGGPRGIMLAFNITDHSVAPTQTVPVHIFRPHRAALPVVHPGDAVLLRHFSITSMTGRGFGLRANDGSSWAVFERNSQDDLPQIRGPPVELSKQETSHAALLKQWYSGLDAKSMAKLDKANDATPAADTGKEDGK
ncbi:hypothetical protein CcaCcLH18_10797 [Colletotrichum camelliae]|nr:hypothetical protein CcaCcLH18_10797 [Colletotrichum camelliae]